ncbi:MAG: PD-(D/E)XK nuclease family protein [bacterium]|nr:PD-(D/E)XK nuclease family protein [bacterium]
MSIHVLSTPYGPPATDLLGERIAELKGGDPLRMVTVIVPTNIAGIGARRALGARQGSLISVDFLKILDVAGRLARWRLTEDGGRPMSGPVLAAAVREVLDAEPGIFRAVSRHPATEQALVRSYGELRDLSEAALEVLAEQSRRASEVVRIHRRARELLRRRWIDEFDLIDAAVEALATGVGARSAADLGPVVVYLPQRITNSQGRLLAGLASVAELSVIAGLSGDDRADEVVRGSLRRMGAPSPPRASPTAASGSRLVSASDADEEVRAAVRRVVNAARGGIPLARMAILYGSRQPYAGLVQEHLRSAGVEFNGPSSHSAAGSVVGRGLLSLLDLNGRGFRRSDVFGLLAAVSAGGTAGGARSVAAWERVARRAGVVRGAEQWSERLGRFASEQREAAEAQRADPEGLEWRAERLEREADDADELAAFVAALVADLLPEDSRASWQHFCDWARKLIETYIGDERSRGDWPQVEQDAADAVLDVLNHLPALDEIDSRPSAGVFRSTVAQELSAAAGRIGRVGRGVLTGPIGYSLGMDLDMVIILGLAEGTFPNQPLDDPLIPDRERESTGGELALRPDRQEQQHLDLLATVASAETAVLVFARGDMGSGAERHPSRWWLDAAGESAGRPVASGELQSLAVDWLEFVPSFAGGTAGTEFPATAQEFRLQELDLCGGRAGELPNHPLLADDPVLARGAELSRARASEEFTRFDGNLAGVPSSSPPAAAVSATSLETWAKCPLRYFLRYILHVEPQEQAEQLLEISAVEKGALVHRILERFLVGELGDGAVPSPQVPWSPAQRDRLMAIAAEQCRQAEAQGVTGKPAYWFHDRNQILVDLRRFLDDDDRRRKELGATPIAGEFSFGMPTDEAGPLPVRLASGEEVLLRGRIDRVDRTSRGGLIVVDYKTGKVTADIRKLPKGSGAAHNHPEDVEVDFVQRGTLLQLPVYGRAAQATQHRGRGPVNAYYWFVSADDGSEVRGFQVTEAVQRRFDEVVATIVGGIETGVFCDRPEPGDGRYSTWCDYCNADRLGTNDRRREWERKRGLPELGPYRDLAEPNDDAGAEA